MNKRLLELLLVFIALLVARGVGAQSVDLTILSPPSPPPLSPANPSVPPAIDLAPFLGKPITDVGVELARGQVLDVETPKITSVKVGMTFSARLARQALADVLESGTIGDAHVDVEATNGGVRVRVVAVPRVVVDAVQLHLGDAEIDGEELTRDSEVQEGDELLASDLDLRKRRMEVFLASAGYPDAKVDLGVRETDRKNRILLIVTVTPGKPRTLQRRVFYAVEADKRDMEPLTADYTMKVGDRVQEAQIEAADVDLERRLRSAGWHEAAVSHDVVLASGLVTLRVRIDAGPRFIAKFDGNQKYDTTTLQGALGLQTENDFSQPHMVDKIKTFYRARAYLDVEVSLDVRPSDDGRSRFLLFHVIEHARVAVAVRSYPCLKEDEVKHLKNAPASASAIGSEIDSYLEEDLPGADLFVSGNPRAIRKALDDNAVPAKDPVPVDLNPRTVFAPDSYDKAIEHLQDLYRNEGYLSASVGPVQVHRRRCGPKSLPGSCIPVDPPPDTTELCTYDAQHLPLPPPALDASQTCVPDFAHHVECEDKVTLKIPVKLGPRTMLYDLAFTGALSIEEARLADAAGLTLGDYVSQNAIEEARRKIVDSYKEEGFFYVDVKNAIEKSPDSTRARVRFDIVEGDRVIVRKIIVRGNRLTREGVILRRLALYEGQPYRTSDVRKTQERISTLGVFSSVSIALQNPYVPTKSKNVIITVVERTPQYIEIRGGISSGEGIRAGLEYGHRNLLGSAIALTARVQASFLPVLELPELYAAGNPGIIENFKILEQYDGTLGRIAGRATTGLAFPDIPLLGPLWRATLDFVALRDIERDFRLNKAAAIATIYWNPTPQVRASISATVEPNDAFVYATKKAMADPAHPCPSGQVYDAAFMGTGGCVDPTQAYCDLLTQGANAFILRVPEGSSVVIGAPRVSVAWDRRDASLNAHRGTYIAASAEHAVSFPTGNMEMRTAACNALLSPAGHFMKLTQTVAGYIPITPKITLAIQLRLGENVQLESRSTTYADRLFFMGGFDSMRGWAQDTFIPQDTLDVINDPANQAKPDGDPTKVTPTNIPLRGGNLMVNPRIELRIPLGGPFETVVFGDFGNLWRDPEYPFCAMKSYCQGKRVVEFPIRAAVGSGIRVQTPVGPLALDYGFNLTRQPYEDIGALSFSVGLF